MVMSKVTTLLAAFVATTALATVANASQITLGANDESQYDFTGNPPAAVQFGVGNPIVGHSAGFFGGDFGNYSFGSMPFTAAGPQDGGNFPTAATQIFSWTASDGDTIGGPVHWSLLKDNSPNPDLIGTLDISWLLGDADFTSAFGVGPTANIDLVLVGKLPDSPFIDTLASDGGQAWYAISAGQVQPVPGSSSVPEPTTLLMIGSALLGFGLVRLNGPRLRRNGIG